MKAYPLTSNAAIPGLRILGTIVLHYRYGEDHCWTFTLVCPGTPPINYACWWAPVPAEERDELDTALCSVDALESLLRSFDVTTAAEHNPAYRFAELLALPPYKWISPRVVQRRTDDFLCEGGRKLGTKPGEIAKRLNLPLPRQLTLPRPDLSAREALMIVTPFMVRFEAPWHLGSLSTYGHVSSHGRGPWRFSYRRGDSGDVIHGALMENGRLPFQGDPHHVLAERREGREPPERPDKPNAVSHPGGQCDQSNRYDEREEGPRAAVGGLREIIHSCSPYEAFQHPALFAVGLYALGDPMTAIRQNDGVPRATAHRYFLVRRVSPEQARGCRLMQRSKVAALWGTPAVMGASSVRRHLTLRRYSTPGLSRPTRQSSTS
jgi:hypothetical protein